MTVFRYLLLIYLLCPVGLLAEPLSTAFTYQGQLSDAGSPADGSFDLSFTLFDAATDGTVVGPTVTVDDVVVDAGLFSVELDFGTAPFAGDQLWLAIEVRAGAETGSFQPLSPRQKLTAAPYALHAEMVAANSVGSAELAPNSVGAAQVNADQVQRRIIGSCPSGESIRTIANDGTVSCEVDDTGESFWAPGATDSLEPDRSVRVQPGTQFPFVVRHDSTELDPQLALTETTDGDFTRLSFYNDQRSFVDPTDPTLWSIAALISDDVSNDRMHFFHRRAGNLLSLTGDGRLGIGTEDPIAPFAVGTQDNWRWDIGNGRGDLYLGDGLVGLSFGVTLAGGGRGFSHIWTNGGVEGLAIGAAGFGAQLTIVDDIVRVAGLAHADSDARTLSVEPDGTLSNAARTAYYSVSPTAMLPAASTDLPYSRNDFGFRFLSSLATGQQTIVAPIHLPHGATVTAMTVWVVDNDSAVDADISASLVFRTLDGSTGALMTLVSSSGAAPDVRAFTDNSVAQAQINNASRAYYLRITSDQWNPAFRILGAQITYEN